MMSKWVEKVSLLLTNCLENRGFKRFCQSHHPEPRGWEISTGPERSLVVDRSSINPWGSGIYFTESIRLLNPVIVYFLRIVTPKVPEIPGTRSLVSVSGSYIKNNVVY